MDITKYQEIIHILVAEFFKITKNLVLAPPTIKGIFNARWSNYNLRRFWKLLTEKKTVKIGLETVVYLASQLWLLLPNDM